MSNSCGQTYFVFCYALFFILKDLGGILDYQLPGEAAALKALQHIKICQKAKFLCGTATQRAEEHYKPLLEY